MGPRAGLDTVVKRKYQALPGLKPSITQPTAHSPAEIYVNFV